MNARVRLFGESGQSIEPRWHGLLKATESVALTMGSKAIFGMIRSDNDVARRYFTRLGYSLHPAPRLLSGKRLDGRNPY